MTVYLVSIPERVWGGLARQHKNWLGLPENLVSIPERVWGGLALGTPGAGAGIEAVSIPERVWGGLAQLNRSSATPGTLVSIPERVWGGLARDRPRPIHAQPDGFNP